MIRRPPCRCQQYQNKSMDRRKALKLMQTTQNFERLYIDLYTCIDSIRNDCTSMTFKICLYIAVFELHFVHDYRVQSDPFCSYLTHTIMFMESDWMLVNVIAETRCI